MKQQPVADFRPAAERDFFVAIAAVNRVLGRASVQHGGRSCPAGEAGTQNDRPILAYCDTGCFDAAPDLLADTLQRLGRAQAGQIDSLPAYAGRAAAAALGDLHRRRRKRLGLPQRPERVADAAWAVRLLPNADDRMLLVHMLTWLGCEAPAQVGQGWPVESWACRYGRSVGDMAASVDRVLGAFRAADPARYFRYVAQPFASKPPSVTLFGVMDDLPLDHFASTTSTRGNE